MATYVLVHGGWHGGWCWQKVTPRLRAAGHDVYTPTLTGLGERAHLLTPAVGLETHIEDVLGVLHYEDLQQVVLVGHSYGGMVITGVADQVPERIAQLVYLDAFVPQDGQSLIDLTRLPEGRDDQTQANLVVEGDPPMAWVPDEIARRTTFACCSDELAAWALERRRPEAVAVFAEPVSLDGFRFDTIPITYVLCKRDQSIPPALQRRMLTAAGCRCRTWRGSSTGS
jgi:pimeloyl-ACP methyl ester carboxylesterase